MKKKKNIIKVVADELLENIDLSGLSIEEADKIRKDLAFDLYLKIILSSIESLKGAEKENLINELKKYNQDPIKTFGVLERYVDNLEFLIRSVISDFKKELSDND